MSKRSTWIFLISEMVAILIVGAVGKVIYSGLANAVNGVFEESTELMAKDLLIVKPESKGSAAKLGGNPKTSLCCLKTCLGW